MTLRAVVLGFAGAVFLALFTFFNDKVMLSNELTGHFVPFAVFGSLVLFVVGINPLLARMRRRWALSAAELAVAVGISLFACFVPGRGLMQFLNNAMIMPQHYARLRPAWGGDPVELTPAQVRDARALADALCRGRAPDADAADRVLWQHFPEDLRAMLACPADGEPRPEPDKVELCQAVNGLLRVTVDWRKAIGEDNIALASYLRKLAFRPPGELDPDARLRLNRGMLDLLAVGAVEPRRPGPVESVPERMLVDVNPQNEPRVLDAFVVGMRQGESDIPLRSVPFAAWIRPWLFWMPLVLAISVAVVGLALVMHRQWVEHEHLPYPTVRFLHELLPGKDATLPAVFRSRWFWAGMALVLGVHLNNYAARWWPDTFIPIRTYVALHPILEMFPSMRVGNGPQLFTLRIDFAALGFAYLLARDVSFSVGIAPWLYWIVVGAIVTRYGIDISAGYGTFSPGIQPSLHAGGYVAMFIVLFVAARRHLGAVFRRGVGLRAGGDPVRTYEIWGARFFLLGVAAFVAMLGLVGLPWWQGVLYAAGVVIISTVVSRLLAEGGVFTTQSSWYAGALLSGLLGARFVGPDHLLIMGIVSSVLLITYREMLMGFAVSALHLCDGEGVRPGRVALSGLLAVAVALVVAAVATLYWQYDYGAVRTGDEWILDRVPTAPYENDVAERRLLAARGLAGEAVTGAAGALSSIAPRRECVVAFGLVFGLVLLFTWCRRRLPGWPLHPLMFIVLGTNDAATLSGSFLAGALVKTLAERYGGWKLCHKLKPMIIGLIAGEMTAGIVVALVSAIYYWVTGVTPVYYKVFLG